MAWDGYNVIIKAGDNHFLKYKRVVNLLTLVRYLDQNFPGWRWFNVFSRRTKQQIGSFTRYNRPSTRDPFHRQ